MPLSAEKQLSINEAATRGSWPQEKIDAVTQQALTEEGQNQLSHLETAQEEHDVQLQRGLGLTATQQIEIDQKATRGDWDQERIDRATAAMVAANTRDQ